MGAGEVKAGLLGQGGLHLDAFPGGNREGGLRIEDALLYVDPGEHILQPGHVCRHRRAQAPAEGVKKYLSGEGRGVRLPAVLVGQGIRGGAEGLQHLSQGGLVPGDGGAHPVQLLAGVAAPVPVALDGVLLQSAAHRDEQAGGPGVGGVRLGQGEAAPGPPRLPVNGAAVKAVSQHGGGVLRPGVGHRQGGGRSVALRPGEIGEGVDRHRRVQGGDLGVGRRQIVLLHQGGVLLPGLQTLAPAHAGADDGVQRRTVRRQGGGIEGVEAAGKGVDQGDTLVGVGGIGEHIGVGDVDVGGVPVAPGGEVQCDGAAGGEPGVLQGGQRKDRPGVGLEDAPTGVAASAGGAAPQPRQQQGSPQQQDGQAGAHPHPGAESPAAGGRPGQPGHPGPQLRGGAEGLHLGQIV